MKVDFSTIIKDLKGNYIADGETPLTLKAVATNALLTENPDDRTSGEEKMKRYCLALEIEKAEGSLDLKAEQIALLKSLIARVYITLVVGRSFEILDA